MSRTGLAVVIVVAAVAVLSGCARKLPPGVLEGGSHVPPPPSEQHRVTSRVPAAPEVPAAEASTSPRLRSPVSR